MSYLQMTEVLMWDTCTIMLTPSTAGKKKSRKQFFKPFSQALWTKTAKFKSLGYFPTGIYQKTPLLHINHSNSSLPQNYSCYLSYYIWLWTYSLAIEKLIPNTHVCKPTKSVNHSCYCISLLCSPDRFFTFFFSAALLLFWKGKTGYTFISPQFRSTWCEERIENYTFYSGKFG